VERLARAPRPDWQAKVEAVGMIYHHTEGQVYWQESAHYRLTGEDVELLESATSELWQRCLDAVQHVIDAKRYAELGIPRRAVPLIEESWNDDHPSIYGRFDLGYRTGEPPKLFEFNADTPTMLLEAAVVQWAWKEEVFPAADQFNSIHERLVAKWKALAPDFEGPVHFAHMESVEDLMTVTYLRDTAEAAGLATIGLHVGELGWHPARGFTDLEERPIRTLFKLYPWEWLLRDEFGAHLEPGGWTRWIEPAWRMLLSNKGILPILWELFPAHPNLLATSALKPPTSPYVVKPRLGREGDNITVVRDPGRVETGGSYGAEGFVYQDYFELPAFDGRHPVVGSWVIDQEPAGVGIRESEGPVTRNESPFVPHVLV
jgi:glutathionylspermidine synthase